MTTTPAENILLDAAETAKPCLPVDIVKDLIQEKYNFTILDLQKLPSYDDQNFRLKIVESKERVVFKISSTNQNFLEVIHNITQQLTTSAQRAICPHVITTQQNVPVFEITHNGKLFRCLMMSYVEGKTLYDVPLKEMSENEITSLFSQIGKEIAIMDRILARECVAEATDRVLHYWDLARTMEIESLVHDKNIKDPKRLEIVKSVLRDFKASFIPRKDEFRRTIIHNDANSSNIIANAVGTEGKWQIGFIDFMDMIHSCTIFELAICLAYLMAEYPKPFQIAKPLLSAYHKEFPISRDEIEILPVLIKSRLATSVTLSAQKRHEEPDNEYLFINEESGWKLLETLHSLDSDSFVCLLKNACDSTFSLPPQSKKIPEIQIMRSSLLGKNLSVSYASKPLKIVRGYMQYLYDDNGISYLDGINNVCHVGHCHPKVVRYAQQQIELLNTNTRYLHDYIVDYTTELCKTFPAPLQVCFLVCSGSEANELALRLARCHTKKENLLVMENAYHGNTGTLVSLSTYKCEGPGGEGLAKNARKVPFPDVYRGCYGKEEPDVGIKYANLAIEIIDELEKQGGIAAFMSESIMGCAGQVVLPDGYLKQMYKIIRDKGGVCIADEVQVGFGRCGSHWWAFEPQNVVPDIVTLAIGNGHPMGAVITTAEIANSFYNGMEYFNTFGGNPVSCAVGLAVLEIIRDENLIFHAGKEGSFLLLEFSKLQEIYEFIGDCRGMGFYLGIEIVKEKNSKEPNPALASLIVQKLKEDFRILISTDGPHHNVLKMKPPMVFSHENSVYLVNSLRSICSSLLL